VSKNDRIVLSAFALLVFLTCVYVITLACVNEGKAASESGSLQGDLWLVVRYDDRGSAAATWWTKSGPTRSMHGVLGFTDENGNKIFLADRWAYARVEDPLSARNGLIARTSGIALVESKSNVEVEQFDRAKEELRRRGLHIPPYDPEVPEKF